MALLLSPKGLLIVFLLFLKLSNLLELLNSSSTIYIVSFNTSCNDCCMLFVIEVKDNSPSFCFLKSNFISNLKSILINRITSSKHKAEALKHKKPQGSISSWNKIKYNRYLLALRFLSQRTFCKTTTYQKHWRHKIFTYTQILKGVYAVLIFL